jgi:hypothetical protein
MTLKLCYLISHVSILHKKVCDGEKIDLKMFKDLHVLGPNKNENVV